MVVLCMYNLQMNEIQMMISFFQQGTGQGKECLEPRTEDSCLVGVRAGRSRGFYFWHNQPLHRVMPSWLVNPCLSVISPHAINTRQPSHWLRISGKVTGGWGWCKSKGQTKPNGLHEAPYLVHGAYIFRLTTSTPPNRVKV